jgi:predicted DCC family thiol-disulfide oxidoreductase YuxK
MKERPVILFDGVCNFCNNVINFVIKRDKAAEIQYAPLQSAKGQLFAKQYNFSAEELKTFVFIEDGKMYTKSTAALRVCRYLGTLWPAMMAFMIVPKFIRNAVYDLVAKNRYKWFGKKDTCMIPTPDVRNRFIG